MWTQALSMPNTSRKLRVQELASLGSRKNGASEPEHVGKGEDMGMGMEDAERIGDT